MITNDKAKESIQRTEDIIVINKLDIEELKAKAALNSRKRIRINMHHAMETNVHEMIIVHFKNNYIRPHKHPKKTESFHVIEGELTVVIFDDQGSVTQKIEMGPFSTGKVFCYRTVANQWHTVIPRSDVVVFHETTDGPFNLDGTTQAQWAPADSDQNEGNIYLRSLSLI